MILILMLEMAFEPIDCAREGIFETPVASFQPSVHSLWMNNFGILPYMRAEFYLPAGVGFGISNFGNELYKENQFVVGYAHNIKMLRIGASVQGMKMYVDDFTQNLYIGIGAAINAKFTSSVSCNFTIQNFNSIEEIPQTNTYEILLSPTNELKTSIQLYTVGNFSNEVRFMNEIKISNALSIALGVKNNPDSFTGGIKLNYKNFNVSYYARTHSELGLSHILGLDMSLKKGG